MLALGVCNFPPIEEWEWRLEGKSETEGDSQPQTSQIFFFAVFLKQKPTFK